MFILSYFSYIFTQITSSAMCLFPLFLWFLLRNKHSWFQSVCYYLFCIYLSAVYVIVGLPSITYIKFDPRFNFIPFIDMLSAVADTLMNVFLFIPFGLFLPLLWRKYKLWQTTVKDAFLFSLGIELLQMFSSRATDIDDLITNVTGAILGFLIFRFFLDCHRSFDFAKKNAICPAFLYATTFAIMFFVQPFLYNQIW